MGNVTEENATGMLEFTVQGGTEDDFFPASVEFESAETFLKTAVGKATREKSERLLSFIHSNLFNFQTLFIHL